MLKPVDMIALVLVIVGALNWALVGLLEFDLVATITGNEFGETKIASRIIYVLVGIAGLWLLSLFARSMQTDHSVDRPATSVHHNPEFDSKLNKQRGCPDDPDTLFRFSLVGTLF